MTARSHLSITLSFSEKITLGNASIPDGRHFKPDFSKGLVKYRKLPRFLSK